MSKLQSLRFFIEERLTIAAVEIFGAIESAISDYVEEVCTKQNLDRHRQSLNDVVVLPEIKLHTKDSQQNCNHEKSPILSEQDPDEPQIKEEQEEFLNIDEKLCQGLNQDVDTSDSLFPASAKIENNPVQTPSQQAVLGFAKCAHSTNQDIEKLFKCTKCAKGFNTIESLKAHRRIHTSGTRDTCSICHKTFSCLYLLKRHMRTHTGEKPYRCCICGKDFNQSGHLQYHIRTHTGERPFQCTVCYKAFNCKRSLNTHMKIHTRERLDKGSIDCKL